MRFILSFIIICAIAFYIYSFIAPKVLRLFRKEKNRLSKSFDASKKQNKGEQDE